MARSRRWARLAPQILVVALLAVAGLAAHRLRAVAIELPNVASFG